jgi:CRISPR-associated protein Csd2
MADKIHFDPGRRHDFVFLFDVVDGNPNGDPDAGNLPRIDPETMQGLVTDVALKRKVRDYVDLLRGGQERFKIYIQSGIALNTQHERAYSANGLKSTGSKQTASSVDKAREWMCRNFYDIRMFGAVMTTSVNCGQVRGPIQLTFARSIDPVVPLDLSITRVTVTRAEDAEVRVSGEPGESEGGKRTEMGRKAIVPYGLYCAHGFFNPHFAKQSGADREDLELFWKALQNMFDLDRSSARGMMAVQGLYVFSHESPLGNAPAQRMFERISIRRKLEERVPRSFSGYVVTVNSDHLPSGIRFNSLVV